MCGNNVTKPIEIIITALIILSTPSFMPNMFEVPYINSVNTTIDVSSDAITVNARFLFALPSAEVPTRIGNSGNMQGARIVNTPAIKDIKISCISTLSILNL
jgi:hypothetical protein